MNITQGHKIALTMGVILIPFNPPLGLCVIAFTLYDARKG